jgi:polyhydroxybutyrate depolymerase
MPSRRGHQLLGPGLAALVLLAAVSSGTLTARAATTGAGPGRSPGCTHAAVARPRPPAGDVAATTTIAGVAHRYLVSVPAHYRADRPTPLVLLFHGFGSDASSIADLTRLPSRGAARGFIVVTPDGPNQTWQLSGTGSDGAYIDGLVATVSRALCVDPSRVYAAGFSQGAAFAIFYACARPGRVAALATVAVDFQLGCTKPISILAFHGTADPAVPYQDGAVGLSLPGVKVRGTLLNLSDWARLDQCRTPPTTTTVGTEVTLTVWGRCQGGAAVRLYTIAGGGHSWPGADPAKNPTPTTQQIDASVLMLNFFAHHRP